MAVKIPCPVCHSGKVTQYINGQGGSVEVDCETCGGTGRALFGYTDSEDVLVRTYKILEATDPTEYVALAPGNVTLYNLIISAGSVDLGPTTMTKAVLWGMFGEGTTTRTNLEELV